jgi:hypothetical protein
MTQHLGEKNERATISCFSCSPISNRTQIENHFQSCTAMVLRVIESGCEALHFESEPFPTGKPVDFILEKGPLAKHLGTSHGTPNFQSQECEEYNFRRSPEFTENH